jgi:Ser/Thr protein kinase RdoA (MazF antagonist)
MQTEASLATFDAIPRGGDAPDWVRDGITAAWLDEGATPAITLISVSENATFRVAAEGVRPMVVRLHQPGYVGDAGHVRSELQWIEAIIRETDIRTAAPVHGRNGDLVQSIVDAGGVTWLAVGFELLTGSILEEHDDLAPYFTEIGAITAQLHEHARAWQRPAGFVRFDWTLDDMVGPQPRWGSWERAALSPVEREQLRRAQTAALDTLVDVGPAALESGLIHADLRPSNIMIDGDALQVIDFDDSGFSFYLYDFASALTFYEHRPEAQAMAANWIDGYRTVTELSIDQLRASAALSMVRRLTMLGWLTTHRQDALPPELWNEMQPGTVELAGRYLAEPLWLVDPR